MTSETSATLEGSNATSQKFSSPAYPERRCPADPHCARSPSSPWGLTSAAHSGCTSCQYFGPNLSERVCRAVAAGEWPPSQYVVSLPSALVSCLWNTLLCCTLLHHFLHRKPERNFTDHLAWTTLCLPTYLPNIGFTKHGICQEQFGTQNNSVKAWNARTCQKTAGNLHSVT